MENDRPKVGVGLLLVKGNKILLGQRKRSHGVGEWGGVGGHMEHLETFESCLLREMAEEAGTELKIQNLRFLCLTNLTRYSPKHYIDIGMVAEWKSGTPIVMEPNKLVSWDWYDMDSELPTPLFACEPGYIKAYKTGQVYFGTV
jgi:8-oxo-dGTP diphosphatase